MSIIRVSIVWSADLASLVLTQGAGLLINGLIYLAVFWVAIIAIQTLAHVLGGCGSYRALAWICSIISVLCSLAGAISGLLVFLPFESYDLLGGMQVVLVIYQLAFIIYATRAINGFGQIKTLISVFGGGVIGLLLLVAVLVIIGGAQFVFAT
ncbi:MAG: hypothetical protein JNJ61_11945 [Anaerolineae bacterium]|nr:hypothetical protein [Anaerolineae bacterium]